MNSALMRKYALSLTCVLVAFGSFVICEDDSWRNTNAFNPAQDPLAEVDSYKAILSGDTNEKWAIDPVKNLIQRYKALKNLNISTHVEVKLVGFSGDGNYGLNVQTADFLRYLEACLSEDSHAYVLNPKKDTPNQLPLRHRYFFRVTKAKPQLAADITKTIHSHTLPLSKSAVPVDEVDKLIQADFRSSGQSHTLYLLNPKAVAVVRTIKVNTTHLHMDGKEHFEDRKERDLYSYWYVPNKSEGKECGTVLWVGKEDRYAWIDLTAGPISYGPHTNGNGLVSDFTVPNLENFRLEDDNAEHHGLHEDDFIAEVTSLVLKSAEALIQPLFHSFPIPYIQSIKIIVVEMIQDKASSPLQSSLSLDILKTELGQTALRGQNIEIVKKTVALSACPLCHASLITATKSRTSTVMRGGLRTTLHDYVNSKELHHTLIDIIMRKGDVAELLGVEDFIHNGGNVAVFPVFFFDLRDSNLLLLDRHYQAVSFPDSIVAIATPPSTVTVDFSCGDEPLYFDAKNIHRPLVASILETVFGVSAPYKTFNHATQKEDVDYTWAIGHCPWGPFSTSSSLSFSQRDAIRRNQIFSEIYSSTSALTKIMEKFFKYEQGIADILLPQEYTHYLRRFNILDYKIEKASMFLALLDYDSALYYARALRHDVRALANIFGRASDYVHSHITCAQDTSNSYGRDFLYLLSILVIFYVLFSSRKFFRRSGSQRKTD